MKRSLIVVLLSLAACGQSEECVDYRPTACVLTLPDGGTGTGVLTFQGCRPDPKPECGAVP